MYMCHTECATAMDHLKDSESAFVAKHRMNSKIDPSLEDNFKN